MVDRQRTLLSLTQKMHAAVSAEDWPMLASLDTLLASTLPQMAAQGPWDAAEKAALSALYQIHQEAARRCGLATAELGRKLSALQAHKEGLLAYALDSELAESGYTV
ncbi:hypothetical protein ASF61_07935 [Duganella sp. Leaf126]|uniref:hypothetical protein n=1 Tax=Duganella sp. Leaf126 TaxID=1736266 RepID=UPI0006F5296E|nr:hypothetical protein [Duganella sp. Leaf126]KQQ36117.1 hypothetical protein ASF61_07935 [Duganella sp. Leaf126]